MMDDVEIQRQVKVVGGLAYSATITRMHFTEGSRIARYGFNEDIERYVSYIFTEHGNGD